MATGAVCWLSAVVKFRPAEYVDAEVLQIIGAHTIPGRARLLIHFGWRMSRHHNHLAPVIGQRIVQGETRPLHSRQAVEAILKLTIERLKLRQRVGSRRPIQRNFNAPVRPVSEVLVLQLVEASRQHGCAGH